ncbi:MAG: hypothetical protein WCV86_03030 [Patescibacteria group bacterium]
MTTPSLKNIVAITVFFLLLTVFFTYPVVTTITKSVAGSGGDVFITLSGINRETAELRDGNLWITLTQRFAALEFSPLGIYTYLNLFLKLPLAYNLYWLFSYVAGGLGMFLLTFYVLSKDFEISVNNNRRLITIASILAGCIYTFNPAHITWSVGFSGGTHTEWIPFATYFLLLLFDRPKLRYFIGFGISAILLLQGDYHFSFFYLLFLIPLILHLLKGRPALLRNKVFWRYMIAAGIICITVLLLVFTPFLKKAFSENNTLAPGLEQVVTYSTDFISIILPSDLHSFFGDHFNAIRNFLTGNTAERSTFLGFTVIAFIIFGFTLFRRKRPQHFLFWAYTGIIGFILALGPFLHIGGVFEPRVPLPYLLLYRYLPFVDYIRAVDRIWVIPLMAFSLIAAYGIYYFLIHWRKQTITIFFMALVSLGMISFEYITIPFPTTSVDFSPYYNFIASDPDPSAKVIDLPSPTNYDAEGKSRYYQTIHQKERISGNNIARENIKDLSFATYTPVLSDILYTFPNGDTHPEDIISQDNGAIGNIIFNLHNIRYITVQKEFIGEGDNEISPESFIRLDNYITQNLDIEQEYQDEQIYAYKIKKEVPASIVYLQLGEGWEDLSSDQSRSFKDSATLKIVNTYDTPQPLTIQFDAKTGFNSVKRFSALYNDVVLKTNLAYQQPQTYSVSVPSVPSGTSTMTLHLDDTPPNDAQIQSGLIISDISYHIADPSPIPEELASLPNKDGHLLVVSPHYPDFGPGLQEVGHKEINGLHILTIADLITKDKNGHALVAHWLPLFSELTNGRRDNYSDFQSFLDFRDPSSYQKEIERFANEYQIHTIAIDRTLLDQQAQNTLVDFIRRYLPVTGGKKNGDNYIILYIGDVPANTALSIKPGSGWEVARRDSDGTTSRYTNQSADMNLYLWNQGSAELSFNAWTCEQANRFVAVFLDGAWIQNIQLDQATRQSFSLHLGDTLLAGIHTIRFIPYGEDMQPLNNQSQACGMWMSNVTARELVE